MIVNILDYRDHRFNFRRVNATIFPMIYPNNTRPDRTKFEITDDMPIFDTRLNVTVIEAIEWANNIGFEVELGLNNPDY